MVSLSYSDSYRLLTWSSCSIFHVSSYACFIYLGGCSGYYVGMLRCRDVVMVYFVSLVVCFCLQLSQYIIIDRLCFLVLVLGTTYERFRLK